MHFDADDDIQFISFSRFRFVFVLQISWFVQNAEPPKTNAVDEEILDEVSAVDESLASEIRLEDEEEDEETEEDRSWRR